MAESKVSSDIRKAAIRRGWLCVKVKFDEDGWPDRLFISRRGTHAYIEFKSPGETPEKLQLYRMGILQGRGVLVTWTDNYDEAVAFLSSIEEAEAELDSEGIPGASNQDAIGAGERGVILRSRFRKDEHLSGGVQDPKDEGSRKEDVDHSAASSDVQGLAGRDQEVD